MGCIKCNHKNNNFGWNKGHNCKKGNNNKGCFKNNKCGCNNDNECSECRRLQGLAKQKCDEANERINRANRSAQEAQRAERRAEELRRQAIEECKRANVLWDDYKRLTNEGEDLMDEAQRHMRESAMCFKDCLKDDVGCNLEDFGFDPTEDMTDDCDFDCDCDCNCDCCCNCKCDCR